MKAAIFTSVLALGFMTVGCKDDDNNDGKTIEQIPSELAGSYKADCQANGVSIAQLGSTARSIKFSAVGDFDKTETYYTSTDCTADAALTYTVHGTAQNLGKAPDNNGLNLLNFAVNDALITPGTQALVSTLNATKFCGKTDWALGTQASISAVDCGNGFTIKKGDVILDVYEDRAGTIFFGKKFALLLNETGDRPKAVDEDTPYHKQ